MNTGSQVKMLSSLIFCVLCSTLLTSPARAEGANEIAAVVRVSKQLIDDVVTSKEIDANIPFRAMVVGLMVEGVAQGKAKLAVEMTTENDAATLRINSRGLGNAHFMGTRRPFVVLGHACLPFWAQTLVQFDGKAFSLAKTTPYTIVHVELDRIQGRHGGPVGRAAGCVLLPLARLLVPRAERQARPVADYYLKHFVDELSGKIVSKLNQETPIEASLNRLFPETKDWVFRMSSDAEYLQAAYGPPEAEVPLLPDTSGRLKNARLEFWLHSTTEGAQALEELSKRPLARQLVQRYLEATLPELAALTEERSVTSIGEWIIIGIGPPKSE